MKNDVWYNKDIIPEQMLLGALGNLDGWVKLENSDHYPILNKLIQESNSEYLCDLGCGAGELGRLYNSTHKYVGYDLEHIIDKVALKLNPNLFYVNFDINNFNYYDLMAYDLIVCNAFLTEMINSKFILKNIIQNTKKSLIIHRQDFSDKADILPTKTYGNLESIKSIIEWNSLYKLLEGTGLHIKETYNIANNSHSMLITK